ncbi:MAG: hypothetical protein JRJ49_08730 [Deltaproteobacteria bacterium]|nr:hypothetical protein [Deltaproteobacteria bacterium]
MQLFFLNGFSFVNEGTATIDNAFSGLFLYNGEKNSLINEATGDFNLVIKNAGLLFQNQIDSEIINFGNMSIDAGGDGIGFSDGENNIINNMSTGIFNIKAGDNAINISGINGFSFTNEGTATIEADGVGIYARALTSKGGGVINNMLTGNLYIAGDEAGMLFTKQNSIEINNYGKTTIQTDQNGAGISFINGENNVINNMSTGEFNIKGFSYSGILFKDITDSEFNNYGSAALQGSNYAIWLNKGENNVINNMSTGSFDIESSFGYAIAFNETTNSEFNNYGVADFDVHYSGAGFVGGKNNVINNMSSGAINITSNIISNDTYGIRFNGEAASKLNNDGNISINDASIGLFFTNSYDNIINNMSSGIFDIKVGDSGIYFLRGANNIINNEATGVLDIKASGDGIYFNRTTGGAFNNYGITSIESDVFGMRSFEGANNIVNNEATGILDIKAGKSGIIAYDTIGSRVYNYVTLPTRCFLTVSSFSRGRII